MRPHTQPTFALALGICLVVASAASGQPQTVRTKTRPLTLSGKTTDTPIAGGGAFVYSIKLKADQFCAIRLRQSSIHLVATLAGPDATELAEVDTPHFTTGDEVVELVAEKSGT